MSSLLCSATALPEHPALMAHQPQQVERPAMGVGSPERLPVEGRSLPPSRLGAFRGGAEPHHAILQRRQVHVAQGTAQGGLTREARTRPADPLPQLGRVFLDPLANTPSVLLATDQGGHDQGQQEGPGVALAAALAGIGHRPGGRPRGSYTDWGPSWTSFRALTHGLSAMDSPFDITLWFLPDMVRRQDIVIARHRTCMRVCCALNHHDRRRLSMSFTREPRRQCEAMGAACVA